MFLGGMMTVVGFPTSGYNLALKTVFDIGSPEFMRTLVFVVITVVLVLRIRMAVNAWQSGRCKERIHLMADENARWLSGTGASHLIAEMRMKFLRAEESEYVLEEMQPLEAWWIKFLAEEANRSSYPTVKSVLADRAVSLARETGCWSALMTETPAFLREHLTGQLDALNAKYAKDKEFSSFLVWMVEN
ncbi:MAG: hypothetical protein AAB473_01695 [Patescibacteria group bacterium]